MVKVKIGGITFECATPRDAIRLLQWLKVDRAKDASIRKGPKKRKARK